MKDFNRAANNIRRMVENANRVESTPSGHTRFHFFTETNKKGLFLFGVYDYISKNHEIVDVFATDTDDRISRMENIIRPFDNKNSNK